MLLVAAIVPTLGNKLHTLFDYRWSINIDKKSCQLRFMCCEQNANSFYKNSLYVHVFNVLTLLCVQYTVYRFNIFFISSTNMSDEKIKT